MNRNKDGTHNLYDYWADGNLRSIEEKVPQPFNYTCTYYAEEVNLYHIKIRHYSQMLLHFLQRDQILSECGITFYSYTGYDFVNYGDWEGLLDISLGGGVGLNLHMLAFGTNIHHYRVISSSGIWYEVYVFCGRIGPGVFIGISTEVSIGISPDDDDPDCRKCKITGSIGIGGDVAYISGIGDSFGVSLNEEGFAGVGATLPPPPPLNKGWGMGFSLGIDFCIVVMCKPNHND